MNVKVRILLSICILTILGAVFIGSDLVGEMRHDPEYTAQSSAVYTSDFGILFMENWDDMGRLYRISESGKVLYMTGAGGVKMDSAVEVAVFNSTVYALYSSDAEDEEGKYKTYRIAAYDENLELVSVSDKFILDSSWTVCSLTADSMDLTISALAPNGGAVSVFALPVRLLQGAENYDFSADTKKNGKDEPVTREDFDTPESLLYRERTTERFFVDAAYVNPELYVLLDGDTPKGIFAPDIRVKTAVDSMSFSFGQWLRLHAALIIKIIGVLLIWLILLILTVKLTKNKDRIVYLYSATEVVFFIILFLAFIFIRKQFKDNEINNNTRFAMMVMQEDMKYYSDVDYGAEDFFESTKYYRLMDSLSRVMNENVDTEVFFDAFVMQKSTGMILADAKGHNGIHASYLYGGEMSTLIEKVNDSTDVVSVDFALEGEELTAIAYRSENSQEDLALVAICKERKDSESYRSSIRGLGILFIIIFLIGSVLLFIALYLQHMDLKSFSAALKGLALGDPKVESPKTVSRDMRELWQSYGELTKRIEEINYEKYRIFEAYYRFAPKGIEKIMGRESIFDVENEDVAKVSGSILLLTIDKEREFETKVRTLSDILSKLEKYAMQNDAILVSRDQGLSNIRLLLMRETGDTVSQIVQFIHTGSLLGMDGWSVLMYKDVLTYGVAGSRSQSLTYIDSEYSRDLDDYAEWFRQIGVPLVVTERIISEEDVGEKRYIGCAGFGDGSVKSRVGFYEILDAYPAVVRQAMLINRNKFEETLDLFYSKNFYLARNQFMEILKDCPEDGVARWYIFECEYYMNGEGDISHSGYIRIDH